MIKKTLSVLLASALAVALSSPAARAQDEKVLNLYSARHYQTDEQLYAEFTKQTGIKINRIEDGDEALLERLRNEGEKSPADVLLRVRVLVPRVGADRLFGDTWLLVLRPQQGRYRVHSIQEEFQLP